MSTHPKRTLAEISDDYGDHVEVMPGGGRLVYADRFERAEYFHCADYAVSSVAGPTLWLIPRAEVAP